MSCPAAGSCVAVGQYLTSGGATENVVETAVGGVWSSTEIAPSAAGPIKPVAISCTAGLRCLVTGSLDGMKTAYLSNLSGTWAAVAAPSPAGADDDVIGTGDSTACLTAEPCFATTFATDRDASTDIGFKDLIDTVTRTGVTVAAAPLPPDARDGDHSTLDAVDCPSTTWCVAGGSYTDATNHAQLLADVYSNGVWASTDGPIPVAINDLSQPLTGDGGSIRALSCAAVGACTGVGEDDWNDGHPLITTLQVGRWAVQTAPTPQPGPAGLSAVRCPSPDNCIAIGSFTAADGHQHPYIDTETS